MPTLPLPGDLVWIRQRRWRVERVQRDRNVVRLDVANRDRHLTFLAPFDRPALIGRADRLRRGRRQQALARLSHLIGRATGIRTLASAIDADVAILPHQLEPALAILHGARRVLIADDVGLGKTIEAGLIVAECLRRQPTARVLVVVPASLREQWTDELRTRFRIETVDVDARRLGEIAKAGAFGGNPWERAGVWIGSLDFLKQEHVLDAMPLTAWDLVVVDEAHGACGESARHRACDELARRGRHVVLLTATPHSGDLARFTRLLNLGRLGSDQLTVFRRTRAEIGMQAVRRVRWRQIAPFDAERHVLDALLAFESAVLRAAGQTHREQALLLLSVFRKRALSTMGALARSIDRRLAWVTDVNQDEPDWIQPRLGFEDECDDVDEDDRGALLANVGMSGRHERSWLQRLRTLVDAAARRESKVDCLVSLLGRAREPVMIFTEFRHSLEVIERRLRLERTLAVLHGGQSSSERRQQLDRFLDGTASVLLATDVAGQGLNLQRRARWIVSFELPWTPARLEQRIGRVDRIGQARSVHATLLVSRHDAESGLLMTLARRALSAQQSLGETVYASLMPDDGRLSAALIERRPLEMPSPPAVNLCKAWQRPARFAARSLETRRRLTRRWQATAFDSGRALWTHGRLAVASPLARPGATFVFSVPILDSNGVLVERHVVAVVTSALTTAARPWMAVRDAARTLARRRLERRLRRVGRFVEARMAEAVEFAAALRGHLAEEWLPSEDQLEFFQRATARKMVSTDAGADGALEIGRPVLELIFSRTAMTPLAGVGGSLFPSRYLATRLLSDSPSPVERSEIERRRRQFQRWWAQVERSCGPATGLRALSDLVAMPLAGLLGFRARQIRFERARTEICLETKRGSPVALVLLPWASAQSLLWRDLIGAARSTGARWCLLVSPPFVSVVDAQSAAIRRSVDFTLPDAFDGPSFDAFLTLAGAGAFDAGLDRLVARAASFQDRVREDCNTASSMPFTRFPRSPIAGRVRTPGQSRLR